MQFTHKRRAVQNGKVVLKSRVRRFIRQTQPQERREFIVCRILITQKDLRARLRPILNARELEFLRVKFLAPDLPTTNTFTLPVVLFLIL